MRPHRRPVRHAVRIAVIAVLLVLAAAAWAGVAALVFGGLGAAP